MSGAVARKYAKALADVAQEEHLIEKVAGDLRSLAEDHAVWTAYATARIREEERETLLRKVCGDRVCPLTFAFMRMVNRKGRWSLFPEMAAAFQGIVDEQHGVSRGEVWTTFPLSDEELQGLERRVGASLKTRVVLSATVDSSLLGGVIVAVNFRAFDGSGRRTLEDLRTALRGS